MAKSSAPKVASKETRTAKSKRTSKRTAKAGDKQSKTARKFVAEKVRDARRATAPKLAADGVRQAWNTTRLFKQFPGAQVPEAFRVLAEKNVAHTRELYEGSKNTLQAVLESWQRSLGAAGRGAAALNGRFIDLAERNIDTGFDLATGLAGARTLGEVLELQANYCRKFFGELQAQVGDRRAQSTARIPRRS